MVDRPAPSKWHDGSRHQTGTGRHTHAHHHAGDDSGAWHSHPHDHGAVGGPDGDHIAHDPHHLHTLKSPPMQENAPSPKGGRVVVRAAAAGGRTDELVKYFQNEGANVAVALSHIEEDDAVYMTPEDDGESVALSRDDLDAAALELGAAELATADEVSSDFQRERDIDRLALEQMRMAQPRHRRIGGF